MRNKILIVDDEELNRELLRQIFERDYEILMAADGEAALEQFNQYRGELAAVLLDLVMPRATGYQVLQVLNAERSTETTPVIVITANTDTDVALRCYAVGAAEIITKPFITKIVWRRVTNTIRMYASRENLRRMLSDSEQKLRQREKQLEDFYENLVDTISDIVEYRNQESGQHVKRVKGLTRIMATCYAGLYPESGLTRRKIDNIVKGSALHDIGKIVIPDKILLKPGRLTAEERRIMETHTVRGCEILGELENVQDEEHYKTAYEIVRHHHERYDGNGYPDKLKGDEIPQSAALVSVADVYDALTSERVYHKAFDKETAYRMIVNGECGVFHPKLMVCLEQCKRAMEMFTDPRNFGGGVKTSPSF